jgi:hypothetical protein
MGCCGGKPKPKADAAPADGPKTPSATPPPGLAAPTPTTNPLKGKLDAVAGELAAIDAEIELLDAQRYALAAVVASREEIEQTNAAEVRRSNRRGRPSVVAGGGTGALSWRRRQWDGGGCVWPGGRTHVVVVAIIGASVCFNDGRPRLARHRGRRRKTASTRRVRPCGVTAASLPRHHAPRHHRLRSHRRSAGRCAPLGAVAARRAAGSGGAARRRRRRRQRVV